MKDAPKIETRTAKEFVEEIRKLIPLELPNGDPGAALVEIFARFMAIVSERLNRVPEKNFLAFLEMIGVGLRAPKAARVPVQFFLSTGSTQEAVVPQGTPLASTGAEPQAFETEKSLTVIPAAVVEAITYDPSADKYTKHDVVGKPDNPFMCFEGMEGIEHSLYLKQDKVFRIEHTTSLTLEFNLDESENGFEKFFNDNLAWFAGPDNALMPSSVVKKINNEQKISVNFSNVSNLKTWEVNGERGYWLKARTTNVLPEEVPKVTGIAISTAKLSSIQPDGVFVNSTKVDLNKGGFFPFGDRPKHNDVLYIGSSEVFSKAGSTVTISVGLVFPVNEAGTIQPVTLLWQFWDGSFWHDLAETTNNGFETNGFDFTDTSKAFTFLPPPPSPTKQTISFTCPDIAAKKEHGLESHWLRVRITDGDYGEDAKLAPKLYKGTMTLGTETSFPTPPPSLADWEYQPATWRPPFISALTLSFEYRNNQVMDKVITYNDFAYELAKTELGNGSFMPFEPFKKPGAKPPTLYLGFDKLLHNSPVSLFFNVSEQELSQIEQQDDVVRQQNDSVKPLISWEYLKGKDEWAVLGIQDETKNLTQPGMVEFIAPATLASQSFFGTLDRYWLRIRLGANLKQDELEKLTKEQKEQFTLAGVFPNTVWAINAVTLQYEVFGSSTAAPGQTFKLTRPPVLEGQTIEVRELEEPSLEDKQILELEGEKDPVSVMKDSAGKPKEIWVCWHVVEHFYLSTPSSRHYVLDRGTGQIRFGNGVNGMIPPPGRDNLRAARYQSGGGKKGNVAAHTITILKRAVPHIDRIDNPVPAGGGSDQESLEEVKARGPLTLKHRNRAVSLEDYEWLAKESALQVARACCLPADKMPDGMIKPGNVQLIIVPDSPDPKPMPTPGLINQVKDYIDARRIRTATLEIKSPSYVEVSVTATVVPKFSDESELVRQRILARLTAFLHPLTGGPDTEGWAFGRNAYISEFAALIEGIEGVDHIKELHIKKNPSVHLPLCKRGIEGDLFNKISPNPSHSTGSGQAFPKRGIERLQKDETLENGGNLVVIAPGELAATGIHDITMASAINQ